MAGEHFLLSKKARTLSLFQAAAMTEERAYAWFKRARWPDGEPTCPRWGCLHGAWEMKNRRFRCKACRHDFSVTSGTIFSSRKLSFRKMVMALALFVHDVKDKAALVLMRQIDVQYKTAFVLLAKLREVIAAERETLKLAGTVEMDAMFIGGYIRPKNVKARRIHRGLAENQNGKRQCVQVMRERGEGGRTVAFAVPSEHIDIVERLARDFVEEGSVVAADEHSAYDYLGWRYELVRNNHSVAYVSKPGASTNQAESYHSRLRRSACGIHHRIAGKYLDWYAACNAYREDKRRVDFKLLAGQVLSLALAHGVSRNMAGYWQGNHPRQTLGRYPEFTLGDWKVRNK